MILFPLLALSHAISLHSVLSKHETPNHSSRISAQQVMLGSNHYECRNVEIRDNIVELQGTVNTALVFDRTSHHSNGVESLLRIWNSTVEMDQLRLDGCIHEPNTPHRSYSSASDTGAFSLFSICSSSVRLSNSEMRIGSGQSPFVVLGRQDAENSEETMICVVGSVLRWTNQLSGATTSIVADSGNLGLSVSVVSCNLDCGRFGSWNGLLVVERKASTSNSDVVRIETLLSDCRLENVTGASPNRHEHGGSKLWTQRLLSNTITKSSSVLSGTVIRDFNDGGDLLCSNTTFTSCSTSTVRPLTRRSIETSLLAPYLRPNLRRHKSQDGRYEWQDTAFGTGSLFDFYDYSSDRKSYFEKGVNFFFSTSDDSIHFTHCNFTNIDGTDPADEEFRGVYGTAILVRCPSSLLVEHCTFESCHSSIFSGAIHVELEHETPSLTVLSSSFTFCYSENQTCSSMINQFSLGTTTLHDCEFTPPTLIPNSNAVSSEAVIASNCRFSFDNHHGLPTLYFIHCRAYADLCFCRFHSQTKLDVDAICDLSWALSFMCCVSNSRKAERGLVLGLFSPTVGEVVNEVVAESSISSTLTEHPSAATIFVEAGDFGVFEISGRTVTLQGWRQSTSVSSLSLLVSKLSGCVESDGVCLLLNLHLAPHSTQHSILTSNGMCSFTSLLIDGIDHQTVPLFVFSGSAAAITFLETKFRNIHNAEATLIEIKSEATISLVHTIRTTSFTDINSTGSGPAAIDIESPKSVNLHFPFFHRCCSENGEVGSIRIVSSSTDPLHNVNLCCLSNRGADNAPTDIMFDGLSKEECETVLANSGHFGLGPHFGWRNGDAIETADACIQYPPEFDICSFPGFAAQMLYGPPMIHPSDLDLGALLNRMTPSTTLNLTFRYVLDTPLIQKPFELDKKSITFNGGHSTTKYAGWQLEQAVSEDVPLVLMKNGGNLDLYTLVVLVDSHNTAPMFFVADGESRLALWAYIVVGDEGSVHRPFILSQGMVSLYATHFRDMNFGSHSCIELNGGYYESSSESSGSLMSSAVNLTTTGNGAFISSKNYQSIIIHDMFFVNCSAQSGGAIFVEEMNHVSIANAHFIACSAKEDGGAAKFILETAAAILSIRMECVNCTARRGGGLFVFFGDGSTVSIKGMYTYDHFEQNYRTHAFENCIAEQGGGLFVDGHCRLDNFPLSDIGFNNWNAEGLGTDVYFGADFTYEDLETYIEFIQTWCHSMSRQSTDFSKLCHVHIAASNPPRSFNLPFPKITLEGRSSDIISPLIDENVSHFFEIAQYVHHKDEDGNNLKTEIGIQKSFYLSERGYCTDQFFSFIPNPETGNADPVYVNRDGGRPLEDPVLEIGADARVEFHDLVFLFRCSAQMLLLTDASAEGLVEQCEFWYDPATDPRMLTDLALFEVVDGTLTLKSTIFTLEGGEGNFGVDDIFEARAPFVLVSPSTSPSASPTVIIDDLTFQRMRLGEGVEALMVFDMSASVSVNDLKFVECNQTEKEETTRIVLTGRNLEGTDVSKWTGFSFLTPSDTLNVGIDTGEVAASVWREVPLRVVLTHFTNTTIETGVSGKDMVGCGEGKWSCRGLVRAGKNIAGNQPCTITVVATSFLDGVFDPETKRTTVQSSSSKSTIEVGKEGVIVNSPDGDQAPFLTLSRLSFSLPPSLDSNSLMKSLGGEFKIDNCCDGRNCNNRKHRNLRTAILIKSDRSRRAGISNHSIVKLADLNDVTFFTAKGTPTRRWTLTITQSSFKGSETALNEDQNENEKLCVWESGAVELEDVNCEVSWTTFSHLRQGAIHARNSIVTFQQAILTNNGISTGLFPSARQNIRCVGSSRISFETSAVGTGEEKNGWVSGDEECVVEGVVGEERKLFFEPTLDSNLSSSTLNKKEKKYDVLIVGTTLIPCGLSLEVFENEKSSTNRVLIPLSEIASEWNETSLSLVIPTTRLSSLSDTPEWLGRISFGGHHTTDSFEMKLSAKMALANEMKKTLPWLIPLIVVLSLLLIVGIILFVLCRRRKQKKPSNTTEMEPTEPIEDEKMDELIHTPPHPPNSALTTLNSKRIGAEDQNTQMPAVLSDSNLTAPFAQCIEALACHGKMEMAVVRKQDTLYARLHTEQGRKVALTTESVRRQLLRGIQKIWETDKHAPILTKLSSHVVMVDFANNVFLNINSDGTTLGENEQNKEATLLGQKRWSAPELDEENAQNSKGSEKAIDYSKAAVFSLGLILWEMETGLVPFGEVDAVNAQRQLGVGSTLKMEGIKDSVMKDAISQCISINPDERPTLTELNEMINPKKDFLPLPSNCSDS